MKLLLFIALIVIPTAAVAQHTPEWTRVYTFEESFIDLDDHVVVGGKKLGRATFRWTFAQPQPVVGNPQLKYKAKLEVTEFDCDRNRVRPLEVKLVDTTGKIIWTQVMDPLSSWQPIGSAMTGRLRESVCARVEKEFRSPRPAETLELDAVAKYAISIDRRLQQTKDFRPIVQEFFSRSYIRGYLRDSETNWFFNLKGTTARKASQADLDRFYVAAINVGYLSAIYFISQQRDTAGASDNKASLIPGDLARLINQHSYTQKYRHGSANFDFLAEEIDSVDRLRSYTDLLEKTAATMRHYVVAVRAQHSVQYRQLVEDFDIDPGMKICNQSCLGLPEGTKLFEARLPLFRLQFAKINGRLKAVSATYAFP